MLPTLNKAILSSLGWCWWKSSTFCPWMCILVDWNKLVLVSADVSLTHLCSLGVNFLKVEQTFNLKSGLFKSCGSISGLIDELFGPESVNQRRPQTSYPKISSFLSSRTKKNRTYSHLSSWNQRKFLDYLISRCSSIWDFSHHPFKVKVKGLTGNFYIYLMFCACFS